MQLRTRASRSAQLIWLWALLPLLLAAGLIIPKMADDAFQFGEVASLRVAGALDSGPWSLANVWSSVAEISSEQALGWPMLLSVWGHSAGWSELIVRAMPFFAGMLTIAWVFRTGHDFFATSAGVIAALLLSASVFFLAYMIHARAFTLVTLFAHCASGATGVSPCTRSRQARARRQAFCSAALACSIRTTSARYSCPRSVCFICSSFPGTGTGGGPCPWSGLPPCSHPLNCRYC